MLNNSAIPSEAQLLYLVSRLNPANAAIKEINTLLTQPLNWNKFESISSHHWTFQFLYYTCNRFNLNHLVPPDILHRSRSTYYGLLTINTVIEQEMLEICAHASRQDFIIIPFRGLSVIHHQCSSHALRHMADIDLLVEPEHLKKLFEILVSLGYQESHYSTPWIKENKIIYLFFKKKSSGHYIFIEPHLVISPPRPYTINFPQLRQRLVRRQIGSKEFFILSKEDLLLSIALHIKRHCKELVLKLVIDAAEVINAGSDTLDWDYIINNARQNHMLCNLYMALYLARELLDAQTPKHIMERIKPHPWVQTLIHAAVNKRNFFTLGSINSILLRLSLFDSLKDLGGYLWQMRLKNVDLAPIRLRR